MKWKSMAVMAAACALGLSACATRPPAVAPAAAPAVPTVAPAVPTVAPVAAAAEAHETITIGDTKLGKVLMDESGHTVYVFEKDKKDESTCYDACAQKWPPVLTNEAPQAEGGLDGKLLGTLKRKDGKTQVSINGMPLYYYADDKAKGDTNGQKVGNVWYAVKPSGEKLEQ